MSIRHEISDILLGYALTGKLTENMDRIMKLINERDNQYQELVEANIDLREDYSDRDVERVELRKLKNVLMRTTPFMPPKISLSEKITKLREKWINAPEDVALAMTLNELAEQAKTLEQELELMKYR